MHESDAPRAVSSAGFRAPLKLAALTRYGVQGASSRMRILQYLPQFEGRGWHVDWHPLFRDGDLQHRYTTGQYGLRRLTLAYARRIGTLLRAGPAQLWWIEKEALPWMPASLESLLIGDRPFVLDFDDAVFHNYDRHRSFLVRRLLGRRIDTLMARARLVVAGNSYLAKRALEAGARRVVVLPTTIDLERYEPRPASPVAAGAPPRLVWIGSPSTAPYLQLLARPLARLAQQRKFVLRVIGGGRVTLPGVEVETVPWTAHSEAHLIRECDVGLMPLLDTPWEQGKCAYKLIQYMACALPTVASCVGANREVTVQGVTGFLASDDAQWIDRLDELLADPQLRARLGAAGRRRVEAEYSMQAVAPRLLDVLAEALAQSGGTASG